MARATEADLRNTLKDVVTILNTVGYPQGYRITTRRLQEVADNSVIPYAKWIQAFRAFPSTYNPYRKGIYIIPPVTDIDTLPLKAKDPNKYISKVTPLSPFIPPDVLQPVAAPTSSELASVDYTTSSVDAVGCRVPEAFKGFVPFGEYTDLRNIIKSGIFYPVYVTGLSGCGKTLEIIQICHELQREMVRVNVTTETDEDDLIGGFRLVNGNTVWEDGPVIVAMKRGAVLLLDEVDLASSKVMCLQPIMEGMGIYVKKIKQMVVPTPGFNVIATANTKGRGDASGSFMWTGPMNEAFLERFAITMEQKYPSESVEVRILIQSMKQLGSEDKDYAEKLAKWAKGVRKTFDDGAIGDTISTRRLVHIVKAWVIFGGDRLKAIESCVNRFEVDTRENLVDFYMKIDDTVNRNKPDDQTTAPEDPNATKTDPTEDPLY
jgi:hypothetical protein